MTETPKEESLSQLATEFDTQLVDPTIDLAADLGEIAVDAFVTTSQDLLKEVPILKSVIAAVKTGANLRDFFLSRKLIGFLQNHKEHSTANDRDAYAHKISSDHKTRSRVVSHLLVFLDRYDHALKAKILSNLFTAMLRDQISLEQFFSLSLTLDRLHPDGIKVLHDLAKQESPFRMNPETLSDHEPFALLAAAGLIVQGSGMHWGSALKITEGARLLTELGILPLNTVIL